MAKKKLPTTQAKATDVARGASRAPSDRHAHEGELDRWEEFATRHAGHAALKQDAIYALPLGLIDSIREILPEFWTPEEERFEKNLARSANVGFFLRRPIRFPQPHSASSPTADDEHATARITRARESSRRIDEILTEEMQRRGRSEQEIRDYFKKIEDLDRKVAARKLSYTGWLVTCREFHRERDRFRKRWAPRIQAAGTFPRFPMSLMGESPPTIPQDEREYYVAYMHFYRQWGLDRLATWDLPVPMRPELVAPSLYPLSHVGESGVVLFAPWYLLRDKDLTLREIAEHQQLLQVPEQLEAWVNGAPKNWGHERFTLMLELYIYLELGLKRRYADRMRRNMVHLDSAISRYLRARQRLPVGLESTQSVKRIRLEMNRRLKT